MSDRFFTYEIQHIFPREILSSDSPQSDASEELLVEIGFDLEALGNKIPLLTQSETIAACDDAPPNSKLLSSEAAIAGHHMWCDKHLMDGPLVSEEFGRALEYAGMTGLKLSAVESV